VWGGGGPVPGPHPGTTLSRTSLGTYS
jgi:hypothetical protein